MSGSEAGIFLLGSLAVMLAGLVSTSPLFLLVDIARNIRTTRHFTAHLASRAGD